MATAKNHTHRVQIDAASVVASNSKTLGPDPFLAFHIKTDFGTIGVFSAPIQDRNSFKDRAQTVEALQKTIALAKTYQRSKAKAMGEVLPISFTGMLPAATHGILDVPPAKHTVYTSGHDVVASAFMLNIDRILVEAGRRLQDEKVVLVGIGHIGSAIIRLLVANAVKRNILPESITMVDLDRPGKREGMHKLKEELTRLIRTSSARTSIHIKCLDPTKTTVPKPLLAQATLILAMTSAANVIPAWDLQPGTLVVDDSFPLAMDSQQALARMKAKGDILFTIAGGLSHPSHVNRTVPMVYAEETGHSGGAEHPHGHGALANVLIGRAIRAICVDDHSITGCVYSSILTKASGVHPTQGKVTPASLLRCYNALVAQGFTGTPLNIITMLFDKDKKLRTQHGAQSLERGYIQKFRGKFSFKHMTHSILSSK